jgi:hypothetical protein
MHLYVSGRYFVLVSLHMTLLGMRTPESPLWLETTRGSYV